jgi:hypothetical protein
MSGVGRKKKERSKGIIINILTFSSTMRSCFAKWFTKNSSSSIRRDICGAEVEKTVSLVKWRPNRTLV